MIIVAKKTSDQIKNTVTFTADSELVVFLGVGQYVFTADLPLSCSIAPACKGITLGFQGTSVYSNLKANACLNSIQFGGPVWKFPYPGYTNQIQIRDGHGGLEMVHIEGFVDISVAGTFNIMWGGYNNLAQEGLCTVLAGAILEVETSTTEQSGLSGTSGWSGASGISGKSGLSGVGVSGQSGYSGVSGISGKSGISGLSGISGFSGQYSGSSIGSTALKTSDTWKFSGDDYSYDPDLTVNLLSNKTYIYRLQLPITTFGEKGILFSLDGTVSVSNFFGQIADPVYWDHPSYLILNKGELFQTEIENDHYYDRYTGGRTIFIQGFFTTTSSGTLGVWWKPLGPYLPYVPVGKIGLRTGCFFEVRESSETAMSGWSGSSGVSGFSGTYSGFSGASGKIGAFGPSGDSGQAGPQGDSGISGFSGVLVGSEGIILNSSGISGASMTAGTSAFKVPIIGYSAYVESGHTYTINGGIDFSGYSGFDVEANEWSSPWIGGLPFLPLFSEGPSGYGNLINTNTGYGNYVDIGNVPLGIGNTVSFYTPIFNGWVKLEYLSPQKETNLFQNQTAVSGQAGYFYPTLQVTDGVFGSGFSGFSGKDGVLIGFKKEHKFEIINLSFTSSDFWDTVNDPNDYISSNTFTLSGFSGVANSGETYGLNFQYTHSGYSAYFPDTLIYPNFPDHWRKVEPLTKLTFPPIDSSIEIYPPQNPQIKIGNDGVFIVGFTPISSGSFYCEYALRPKWDMSFGYSGCSGQVGTSWFSLDFNDSKIGSGFSGFSGTLNPDFMDKVSISRNESSPGDLVSGFSGYIFSNQEYKLDFLAQNYSGYSAYNFMSSEWVYPTFPQFEINGPKGKYFGGISIPPYWTENSSGFSGILALTPESKTYFLKPDEDGPLYIKTFGLENSNLCSGSNFTFDGGFWLSNATNFGLSGSSGFSGALDGQWEKDANYDYTHIPPLIKTISPSGVTGAKNISYCSLYDTVYFSENSPSKMSGNLSIYYSCPGKYTNLSSFPVCPAVSHLTQINGMAIQESFNLLPNPVPEPIMLVVYSDGSYSHFCTHRPPNFPNVSETFPSLGHFTIPQTNIYEVLYIDETKEFWIFSEDTLLVFKFPYMTLQYFPLVQSLRVAADGPYKFSYIKEFKKVFYGGIYRLIIDVETKQMTSVPTQGEVYCWISSLGLLARSRNMSFPASSVFELLDKNMNVLDSVDLSQSGAFPIVDVRSLFYNPLTGNVYLFGGIHFIIVNPRTMTVVYNGSCGLTYPLNSVFIPSSKQIYVSSFDGPCVGAMSADKHLDTFHPTGAVYSGGSGTASLSTNCPAVSAAKPAVWLTFELKDGRVVYVPAWE